MYRTIGVVEVETLPQHGIVTPLRQFAGKSLLEWVVRRASDAHWLDHIVVVANDDRIGKQLAQALPPDVSVLLTARPDSVSRLTEALSVHQAQSVLRLRLETPLTDPMLVDGLVAAARKAACDYAAYSSSRRGPAVLSSLTPFAEWISAKAIEHANREAQELERNQLTQFIVSRPESFVLRLVPLPSLLDRSEIRWNCESEEDWEEAQTILDALGPDRLEWRRVVELLDRSASVVSRPRTA